MESENNKNIVLVGMPGAGKSYIGNKLAKLLVHFSYVDIDEKIEKRISLHERYIKEFESIPAHIKLHADKGRTNSWLNLLHVDTDEITPMEIVTKMQNAQIETRPAWKPMHMQQAFAGSPCYGNGNGERLFSNGICLPSGKGAPIDLSLFR